MSLVIPPGYAQCVLRFRCSGDAEEAVTTIGQNTETIPGGATNTASFVRDAFLTAWPAGQQVNTWTFVGVTAYLGQDGGPPAVVESLSGRVGTATSSPPPINCALLVRKETGLGGRTHKGRMYLPPFMMNEGLVDQAGVIDTTSLGTMQGYINAFRTATHCVLLHDSTSPGDHFPTPITALTAQTKIATQRRRLRR